MKAVLMENGRVVIKDVPVPKLQPGDVLVKMKACGICGTDIEKIHGQYTASMPVLGHEPSGIIEESTVEWLKEGMRVFAHHHVPDYTCYYCTHGSPTMCPMYRRTNLDPGGFAEYFRVPAHNVRNGGVLILPDHVTFEEGAFVEPLATVVRAQRRAGIRRGDHVLVVGTGPMGMLHIMLAKAKGAGEVIVSEPSEFRLNFSLKVGADHALNPKKDNVPEEVRKLTEGRGVDVAIVASGAPQAILTALHSVRKGGTVLLFGVPYKGTVLDYDVSELLNNEISIIPSNAAVEEDTREALQLIAEGKINVSELVTHRFGIDEFLEAVKVAESGEAIKVLIVD